MHVREVRDDRRVCAQDVGRCDLVSIGSSRDAELDVAGQDGVDLGRRFILPEIDADARSIGACLVAVGVVVLVEDQNVVGLDPPTCALGENHRGRASRPYRSISCSLRLGSLAHSPCAGSANQGGISRFTTTRVIDFAQGLASSKLSSDIGAISPGRWQLTQLPMRIGATSRVKTTLASSAAIVIAGTVVAKSTKSAEVRREDRRRRTGELTLTYDSLVKVRIYTILARVIELDQSLAIRPR